jgi:hypothetical protein
VLPPTGGTAGEGANLAVLALLALGAGLFAAGAASFAEAFRRIRR